MCLLSSSSSNVDSMMLAILLFDMVLSKELASHSGLPVLSVSKKWSLRASDHTGVAIPHKKQHFFGQKTRVSRKNREIATPAFGLVRDDPVF